MAQRRMYSRDVVRTDKFLEMPLSAQALYFHLGMEADDDGFVSSPKQITRMIGAREDDFRLLIAKGYVLPFETGVCVVTHWKMNNYLRSDRYRQTIYKAEAMQLTAEPSGAYLLQQTGISDGSPLVYQMVDQVGDERYTQDSIGKDNIDKAIYPSDKPKSRPRFSPPTVEQVSEYVRERGSNVDPQYFVDFYASKGWRVGNHPMKDWKAACRNAERWERHSKKKVDIANPRDYEYYEGSL